MEPRVSIFRSLYWKISSQFLLILTVSLGTQLALFTLVIWRTYVDTYQQRLQWDLASNLVHELAPLLDTQPIDEAAVKKQLYRLTTINPGIDIYLLDRGGATRAALGELPLRRIDLEPLERFINLSGPPDGPIYGDPPRADQREKAVFSAARIRAGDERWYVYVLLTSDTSRITRDSFADAGSLAVSLLLMFLTLVTSSAIGLTIFYFITRRFHRMTQVLQQFRSGDFTSRIPDRSNDELGTHARVFNEMADTIVANIQALKDKDEQRRQLVASISHDLRRPISLIHALLETMSMKSTVMKPDELSDYIARTLRTCTTLDVMIDELFELSKLNAREAIPNRQPFSLVEMTDDLLVKFASLANERTVALHGDFSDSLPSALADEAMIDRVLGNLIENGIRYTPVGGSVTVRIQPQLGQLLVEIIDTGIGIPADDIPYLFEPFFRTKSAQAKESGGTGLGLAIAKKMIEAHGSTLEVESVEGRGTTFRFLLAIAP